MSDVLLSGVCFAVLVGLFVRGSRRDVFYPNSWTLDAYRRRELVRVTRRYIDGLHIPIYTPHPTLSLLQGNAQFRQEAHLQQISLPRER
jgi:hypothetical protein